MMGGYEVEFVFRGLYVTAQIEEYDPGTRQDPPSGGGYYAYEFNVKDIDELICELKLGSEGMDNIIRGYHNILGGLPATLLQKIHREWCDDIKETASDYFWRDLGGPSGYRDDFED